MPSWLEKTAGVIAVLLFVWMTVLFFRGPTFSYDSEWDKRGEIRVECGSVVGVGWPTDRPRVLDENGNGFYADIFEGDTANLPRITLDSILHNCEHRRTTYVGTMAILAAPTALLAVLAIRSFRRATDKS